MPAFFEDLPDRRRRHHDAQPCEFAVDAAVAPCLVLPGQPQHHRPHLAMRRRAAAARQPRPPAPDDVAVPAQDRGRGHDQPHPRQPPGRQRPGENGQPRPVRPRQPGRSPRPFPQGDSELVPQHEDLGVLPPRLPPPQTQQRHDTGRDEEDQLQAHKPKIIPPPARPAPASPAPDAAGHPPRWHRFSAPTSAAGADPDRGPQELRTCRIPPFCGTHRTVVKVAWATACAAAAMLGL